MASAGPTPRSVVQTPRTPREKIQSGIVTLDYVIVWTEFPPDVREGNFTVVRPRAALNFPAVTGDRKLKTADRLKVHTLKWRCQENITSDSCVFARCELGK